MKKEKIIYTQELTKDELKVDKKIKPTKKFWMKKTFIGSVALLSGTITLFVLPFFLPTTLNKSQRTGDISFYPCGYALSEPYQVESLMGINDYEQHFEGDNWKMYLPKTTWDATPDWVQRYNSAIFSFGSNILLGVCDAQQTAMQNLASLDHLDFVTFSLVDSFGASKYKNGMDFTYASEQSGLISGIAGSIYATTISQAGYDPLTNSNNPMPRLATWGGRYVPSTVNLPSGFEQGINWFNYAVLGYDITNTGSLIETDNFWDIFPEYDYNGDGNLLGNPNWKNYTWNLKDKMPPKPFESFVSLVGNPGKPTTPTTYYQENYKSWATEKPDTVFFSHTRGSGSATLQIVQRVKEAGAVMGLIDPFYHTQAATANNLPFMSGSDQTSRFLTDATTSRLNLGSIVKKLSTGVESSAWFADRWTKSFDKTKYNVGQEVDVEDDWFSTNRKETWNQDDEKMYNKFFRQDGTAKPIEENGFSSKHLFSQSPETQNFEGEWFQGTYFNGGAEFIPEQIVQFWEDFVTMIESAPISLNNIPANISAKTKQGLEEFMNWTLIAQMVNGVVSVQNGSPTFSDPLLVNSKYSNILPWIQKYS